MNLLRNTLCLVASLWLAIAGVIIPKLWDISPTATAHVVIIAVIALVGIVLLNKPESKNVRK